MMDINSKTKLSGLVKQNSKTQSGKYREHRAQSLRDDGSVFSEVFQRYRSQRLTVRLDQETPTYHGLVTKSTLQYFKGEFGGATAIRFTEDGQRIAVGFNSGDLQLISPGILERRSGSIEVVLKGWEGNHSISCLRFHPRHTDVLYASSTSGTMCRRDLNIENIKFQDFFLTEAGNEINGFDFDVNGNKLVTGGKDAAIRVYDTVTDKLVLKYGHHSWTESFSGASLQSDDRPHEKRIYCVRCHPEEPHVVLSGGWDRVVKVWDTRIGESCVRNIVGPYIYGESIDINKGRILTASCVASNSIDLWDLGTGNLLTNVVPTNRRVYLNGEFPYTAQFFKGDPTGDLILCGGSGLGGLQVISIKEASILYLFEDEKSVLAVDSKNSKLAFGGKSNCILSGNMFIPEEIPSEGNSDNTKTSDPTSELTTSSQE